MSPIFARALQPAGPAQSDLSPIRISFVRRKCPLMDVQPFAVSFGIPGERKARTMARAASRPAPVDSGGGGHAAIPDRPPMLLAYTAASIIAGLTALAWTTLRVPISPTIDPQMDGSALAGPSGGLLLWICFGMIGSL